MKKAKEFAFITLFCVLSAFFVWVSLRS